MIASLQGNISEKRDNQIIIDVGGVGYGVYVTNESLSTLDLGEEYKVFIYEHVREQAHDLFGFIDRETQNLFEQLLEVNGVGPKMALNVLSIGPTGSLKEAIASGDVKHIQQANGVGKRVAERVVVELKDKVGLASIDLDDSGILQSSTQNLNDEAIEALMSLGYSPNDAAAALKSIDKELSTEDRVKLALKGGK
jgi:Holliday junction DNA helicase RuvA